MDFSFDHWYRGRPVSNARATASTDFRYAYRGDLGLAVGVSPATTVSKVSTDTVTASQAESVAASLVQAEAFAAYDAGTQSVAATTTAIVSADGFGFSDGLKQRTIVGSTTYDDFTGTSGASIDAAKWTIHPSVASGGSDIAIDSTGGRARGNRSGISIYYGNSTPPSADQSLEWDFVVLGTPVAGVMEHGFGVRVSTSADSGYYGVHYRDMVGGVTGWRIVKRLAGVETTLNSATATLTDNVTYHVAFSVSGSSLSLSVDGSVVCTATDSAISATGRYGVYMDPINTTTTADGRLDNLTITGSATVQDSITPEKIYLGYGDAAASADLHGKLIASLKASEAFAGYDGGTVTIVGPVPISSGESFTLADKQGAILASLPGWDSWAAIESTALTLGFASLDAFSAAETAGWLTIGFASVDAFAAGETTGGLAATLAYGDEAGLDESARVAASLTTSDAFSGDEAGLDESARVAASLTTSGDAFGVADGAVVSVLITSRDGLAFVNAFQLAAGVTSGDAATKVEEALAYLAPVGIFAGDSAGFSELLRLDASVSDREPLAWAEITVLAVGVFASESFAVDSRSSVGLLVSSSDSFAAFDAASVTVYTATLNYRIYANDGAGGPINYDSVVSTTASLSWASGPLAFAGDYSWGVRTFSAATGLEERNLDAAVRVMLDAAGADATSRPEAPTGLRAIPLADGYVRVEWMHRQAMRARKPTGFRVYQGTASVDWGTVVATVAASGGISGAYATTLGPLADGTTYRFGVRAYNAAAEESNTIEATARADATGPAPPASLTLGTTTES